MRMAMEDGELCHGDPATAERRRSAPDRGTAMDSGRRGGRGPHPPLVERRHELHGRRSSARAASSRPILRRAAGPTQIVETINGTYCRVLEDRHASRPHFARLLLQHRPGGGRRGKRDVAYSFDPRIAYDEQSQRFFVAGDDNPQGANSFIIAVSNSSDATAGWKAWKVASDPTELAVDGLSDARAQPRRRLPRRQHVPDPRKREPPR